MKKLLLIFGLLFAIPVFADYYAMDGSTHQTAPHGMQTISFKMSTYQKVKVPTMKHFIKPFQCKIWTNYEGDTGYGVKIVVMSVNAIVKGTYPNERTTIILTKDNPLVFDASFGIVKNLYGAISSTWVTDYGCSPFDSHCTTTANSIIYESCNLI